MCEWTRSVPDGPVSLFMLRSKKRISRDHLLEVSGFRTIAARKTVEKYEDLTERDLDLLLTAQCVENDQAFYFTYHDLVRYMGLSHQFILKMLHRLRNQGYVERKSEVNRHKATRLSLTFKAQIVIRYYGSILGNCLDSRVASTYWWHEERSVLRR